MRTLALLLLLSSSLSLAQDPLGLNPPPPPPPPAEGQAWSMVGGRTLGFNKTAVEGGMGFPGMHVSLMRGVTDNVDIGGRVGFNYAVEGLLPLYISGVRGQFAVKVRLVNKDTVSLALRADPGIAFYFMRGSAVVAMLLPIGFSLGIAASSAVTLSLSFDLPMWIGFSTTGGPAVLTAPVLSGAGVEYFVSSDLLVYLSVKMGPSFESRAGSATLTMEGKVGVAYRF